MSEEQEEMTEYINKTFIKETDIKKIRVIHDGHTLDVTKDYTRTWLDLHGNPYRYEFRGNNFMGYLNPDGVVITK